MIELGRFLWSGGLQTDSLTVSYTVIHILAELPIWSLAREFLKHFNKTNTLMARLHY